MIVIIGIKLRVTTGWSSTTQQYAISSSLSSKRNALEEIAQAPASEVSGFLPSMVGVLVAVDMVNLDTCSSMKDEKRSHSNY